VYKIKSVKNKILLVIFFVPITVYHTAYAHLCDNVFRQKDKLIVKPETYNITVKDKATFKIFLQNNMDRGIAEISLIAESPAFDFEINPKKMPLPKDQRAFFQVSMTPKSTTRTGNYTINFRLVGGGKQFKSFNLSMGKEAVTQKADVETESDEKKVKETETTKPKKYKSEIRLITPESEIDKQEPQTELTEPREEETKTQKIKFFPPAPVMDGALDDELWKTAKVLSNFSSPQKGTAWHETIILVSCDTAHMYLGIYCETDKSQDLPRDDTIEIKLARNKEGCPYSAFLIPVSGTPSFKNVSTEGTEVHLESKDIKYCVVDNGEFWSAELEVPFFVLGFESRAYQGYWYMRITRNKSGREPQMSFWAQDESGYNDEKGFGKVLINP